ncbi:MAG: DUF664 domain-containing protein [Armatimonadetes bacterium]|nr:DUF664 domain-containing protein [Armatimonadota bacterium]MBS1711494.1 DUF664 domain-containing protein [Armatimonadota bacterium]MBX3107581.1 DUF664 domain-containing protein [Fimbriimonadaceae bacterium]
MAEIDVLLKAWDAAHWELGEAFKGLQDSDVWRRVDPRLLSIGELTAHMAYGEATNFGIPVESPLIDRQNRYYPVAVVEPFSCDFGAEALYNEFERIHQEVKAGFLGKVGDLGDQNPSRPDWTWGATLEYMVFHVAYHTGQIYSVRHLMGHETEDN